MGDLGAIHEDVRFDWGKASTLAAEFRTTAGELDRQVGERNRIKGPAIAHWRGRYEQEFEGRVATCTGDASRFATAMRDAATKLDEMARLAREEQDRREQAREWERRNANSNEGEFWDGVGDFFFGEDDEMPPPPPPVQPPSIPIEAPAPGPREAAV